VVVLVGDADEVAAGVVAVGVGVVGAGAGGLDDGLELVRCVVGVLDDVAELVGDAGLVARAVVGLLGNRYWSEPLK
jgi:hypothetical protein